MYAGQKAQGRVMFDFGVALNFHMPIVSGNRSWRSDAACRFSLEVMVHRVLLEEAPISLGD